MQSFAFFLFCFRLHSVNQMPLRKYEELSFSGNTLQLLYFGWLILIV